MRQWPFRKIYLYLVCLITMLFILFGVFGAVHDFVSALYPASYGPGPIDSYYRGPDQSPPPQEIIEAQKEFEVEQRLNMQRRDMAMGVGRLAAVLLVAVPVFIFHWRLTRLDD